MNHVNLQDLPGRGHAGGVSKGPCKDFSNRSEAMLLVLLYDAVFQILKRKNQLFL